MKKPVFICTSKKWISKVIEWTELFLYQEWKCSSSGRNSGFFLPFFTSSNFHKIELFYSFKILLQDKKQVAVPTSKSEWQNLFSIKHSVHVLTYFNNFYNSSILRYVAWFKSLQLFKNQSLSSLLYFFH